MTTLVKLAISVASFPAIMFTVAAVLELVTGEVPFGGTVSVITLVVLLPVLAMIWMRRGRR
jgi:hypothetical protein